MQHAFVITGSMFHCLSGDPPKNDVLQMSQVGRLLWWTLTKCL